MIYTCQDCGYDTSNLGNFKRQINRKNKCHKIQNTNNTVDNNVQYNDDLTCKQCKKKLSCKSSLKRHLRICSGVDSKTCPKCLKVFSSVSGKNNHMRTVKCSLPSNRVHMFTTCLPVVNNSKCEYI